MSSSEGVSQAILTWTAVFMHRSMCDFRRFMEESGLSFPQIGILMRLYHHGGSGVSELGTHLGVTSAAASQIIDRLVQMGLIERQEDTADRRMRRLTLTSSGRALVEQGIAARSRWMMTLTNRLSPEEQKLIISALTILTEAAARAENGQ